MTELLRRAFAELEKLPDDQQNAIATRLLEELKDEQAWLYRFESTTNEQWDRLAAMVRKDIANGETIPVSQIVKIIE